MPRYLVTAEFAAEGWSGLLREGGAARRAAVRHVVSDLHGWVDSFDLVVAEHDVVAVVELPDQQAAAALASAVNADGRTRVHAVALATPEEVDGALREPVRYLAEGAHFPTAEQVTRWHSGEVGGELRP